MEIAKKIRGAVMKTNSENSKNKEKFFKWLSAFDTKNTDTCDEVRRIEKAIHYWNCYYGTKYKYLMTIQEYSNWKKGKL